MTETPLALAVQITQEYLGQSVHLVNRGGMWKEVLDADTYVQLGGRGRRALWKISARIRFWFGMLSTGNMPDQKMGRQFRWCLA